MTVTTPQDLFYITTSVVIIVFGILLILITFYFAVLVKKTGDLIKFIQEEVAGLSIAAHDLKEKIVAPAAYINTIVATIIKGMQIVNKHKKRKNQDEE